jgi:tripartite-type tricarboxylate transporter receptor subunit TctC
MKIKNLIYAIVSSVALILSTPSITLADTYPTKPIKIIVPTTPGGGIDVIARLLGEKLEKSMGQPVVIENRPGASTNFGADIVSKAAPDGYTLCIVGPGHIVNKNFYKDIAWDPEKSFEPVIYTHSMPMIFAINKDIPVKTIPEFVAWVKANPSRAIVATTGRGAPQDLSYELFKLYTKVDMVVIPYKGSTAAHPDLIGGRTSLMIDNAAGVTGHIKAGNLRAIGVSTLQRIKQLPDVPTADEQGLKGYYVVSDGGILAPAGTPKAIVDKLNAEINAALKSPDVIERLTGIGINPQGGTSEHYAKVMKADIAKWNKFLKGLGVTPE